MEWKRNSFFPFHSYSISSSFLNFFLRSGLQYFWEEIWDRAGFYLKLTRNFDGTGRERIVKDIELGLGIIWYFSHFVWIFALNSLTWNSSNFYRRYICSQKVVLFNSFINQTFFVDQKQIIFQSHNHKNSEYINFV